MVSSLRVRVYLLWAVFSRSVTVPCKTISLGSPEVAEPAGHSSRVALRSRMILPVNRNCVRELGRWGRRCSTGHVASQAVQLREPVCTEALTQGCWASGPEQMWWWVRAKRQGGRPRRRKHSSGPSIPDQASTAYKAWALPPNASYQEKVGSNTIRGENKHICFFPLPILLTIAVCRQIMLRSALLDQCREWFPSARRCQTHWMLCKEPGPWTSSQRRRYLSGLSCTCSCSCSHSPHFPVLGLAGRSEGRRK